MKTKGCIGEDVQAQDAHPKLSRRTLLHFGMAAAAAGTLPGTVRQASGSSEPAAVADLTWEELVGEFDVLREPINLISGANNPSPKRVLEALVEHQRYMNPSPLARGRGRKITERLENLRSQLARIVGVDSEEIALTRSTTEGMNNILFGLDLKPGDEILTTRHDYPSMKDALYQRARRDGVVVREIDWTPPIESQEAFADLLISHFSERTKAILLCHIYDGYGQIAPIRRISEVARARGIHVIVDGALGFGNLSFNLRELGCDYYATSMHKWLGAPLGTGFLYVRRERIESVTPLFGVPDSTSSDIRKFEDVGSTSPAPLLAAAVAADLYEQIGPQRKAERLQYLKRYWSDRLSDAVTFLVRRDAEHSGAALSFAIENIPPRDLWLFLLRERNLNIGIHPYRVREGFVQCNYIAPNVFTTMEELDLVVHELSRIAERGLPTSASS